MEHPQKSNTHEREKEQASLYRYEVRIPAGALRGQLRGMMISGFDMDRLAEKRHITLEKAAELRENVLTWFFGKFEEGEIDGVLFFFTKKEHMTIDCL